MQLSITVTGEQKEMLPILTALLGGKAGKKIVKEDVEVPEEEDIETAEEDTDGITIESIVKTLQAKTLKTNKNRAANITKIKALFAKYKIAAVTDLKEAKFDAFAADLEKIK